MGIATAGSKKRSMTANSMIPPAIPRTAETTAVSRLAPQRVAIVVSSMDLSLRPGRRMSRAIRGAD